MRLFTSLLLSSVATAGLGGVAWVALRPARALSKSSPAVQAAKRRQLEAIIAADAAAWSPVQGAIDAGDLPSALRAYPLYRPVRRIDGLMHRSILAEFCYKRGDLADARKLYAFVPEEIDAGRVGVDPINLVRWLQLNPNMPAADRAALLDRWAEPALGPRQPLPGHRLLPAYKAALLAAEKARKKALKNANAEGLLFMLAQPELLEVDGRAAIPLLRYAAEHDPGFYSLQERYVSTLDSMGERAAARAAARRAALAFDDPEEKAMLYMAARIPTAEWREVNAQWDAEVLRKAREQRRKLASQPPASGSGPK